MGVFKTQFLVTARCGETEWVMRFSSDCQLALRVGCFLPSFLVKKKKKTAFNSNALVPFWVGWGDGVPSGSLERRWF